MDMQASSFSPLQRKVQAFSPTKGSATPVDATPENMRVSPAATASPFNLEPHKGHAPWPGKPQRK